MEININKIRVKKSYRKSKPRPEKFSRKLYEFENGTIDPIIVDRYYRLIDGYITYLIYKERDIEYVPVQLPSKPKKPSYRNSPTLYIYGRHLNKDGQPKGKEYVYRASKNLIDFLDAEKVLVYENNKKVPILITRTEVLDHCPVGKPVAKVARVIKGEKYANQSNIRRQSNLLSEPVLK